MIRGSLLLACALATGCGGGAIKPEDLEVVRAEPVAVDPSERTRLVELEATCAPPPGQGPYQLWLPLPTSDRWQTVRSLLFEVPPPGAYELADGAAGERVLHVSAPAPGPVAVRAVIERPAPAEGSTLPDDLRELVGLEPAAWVEAATRKGRQARVATGVAVAADGKSVVESRWPEVLVDEAWTPVVDGKAQLPQERVRLPGPARATLDGKPAEPRTTWALHRGKSPP